MIETVYGEYKKLKITAIDITKNFWKEQNVIIKEYHGKVYGANITWSTIDEIKFD